MSSQVKIFIDPKAGFCTGVTRAISMLEGLLEAGEKVFALGAPVHNEAEILRLESKGLVVIHHNQIQNLPEGSRVFIRAHGEPPNTYDSLREKQCLIIDGSCPVVLRLQNHVKKASEAERIGTIVYGKASHPEVKGLLGQSVGKVMATQNTEDIVSDQMANEIFLCAQTTMELDAFRQFSDELNEKLKQSGWNGKLRVRESICSQVNNRWPALKELAQRCDLMLFISGRESSNGRMLFEKLNRIHERSFFVSELSEFQHSWLEGAKTIGISGATSTPRYMLEALERHVLDLVRP